MVKKSLLEDKNIDKYIPAGVYQIDYFKKRQKKKQLIYRLNRRTDEVEYSIRKFSNCTHKTILDIGTADGLMLDLLHKRLGSSTYIGLEYNFNLLNAVFLKNICKIQGDMLYLPIYSEKVDIIIATAVIEHVEDPHIMLEEYYRVLQPNGIIILTTPNPAIDWVAEKLGIVKDTGHQNMFSLKKLCKFVESHDFEILDSRKFMFSPIGFPFEKWIETVLGPIGLKLIMANQIVVAKKKDR